MGSRWQLLDTLGVLYILVVFTLVCVAPFNLFSLIPVVFAGMIAGHIWAYHR